jgi:hypothetical protein
MLIALKAGPDRFRKQNISAALCDIWQRSNGFERPSLQS